MTYLKGTCPYCRWGLILSDGSGSYQVELYPMDGDELETSCSPKESIGVKARCPNCNKTVYCYADSVNAVIGYKDHMRGWYEGDMIECENQ